MATQGRVREWHDDDGWGVIDCPATPGGCWAHFSAVQVSGYLSLEPGQAVELTFESTEQDGYAFRATAVWLAGVDPSPPEQQTTGPSEGYRSRLELRLDDEDDRPMSAG